MPKLSIIVPVYNVEKYLEKCLNTVKNQTFKDFEALIINDGTPDNSMKIAEKFEEKYPVLLADERFTTQATYAVERFERQKFGSKHKIKFKEKNDDARTATVILNDVLDGLNRGQNA